MNTHIPLSKLILTNMEHFPEYFAKPKIVEGLAETHPVLLIRQMANEILRLRQELSNLKENKHV